MGIRDRSGRLRHSAGIETKPGKFTRLSQKDVPLPFIGPKLSPRLTGAVIHHDQAPPG